MNQIDSNTRCATMMNDDDRHRLFDDRATARSFDSTTRTDDDPRPRSRSRRSTPVADPIARAPVCRLSSNRPRACGRY